MKLEEAIKQKRFKSEYQKLMVNILYTGNWAYNLNKRFLRKFTLSPEQYNVLRILRGQHPHPSSVALLNERMLDRMSNVSRLVEKLRIKNLLERKECDSDRRQVDIMITDAGLQLLNEIDSQIGMMENNFKTISLEEAQTINELLDKIRN
jgi:DNA-binding MarR family transcriptional regulator